MGYRVWVIRYGVWGMGYGLWAMGYRPPVPGTLTIAGSQSVNEGANWSCYNVMYYETST